ncbi:MAG: GNAT family N-acetyltransferase [Allorhizobium sp.]
MVEIIRINSDFERWTELLGLMRDAFAYMDGLIDPQSSALSLTAMSLEEKAQAEIAYGAIEGGRLVGCIFCRPEPPDFLYIGKLAVDPGAQGKGIGRLLLARAEATAAEMALPILRLETRIELTDNHACFAAWGFVRTAENRHAGFERTTSIEMQKQRP